MALKDNYFTISEAARELNVTRQTISRWVANGKLAGEKIGRETLINKKDLFEEQRHQLTDTAAGQIVTLMYRTYTDFCQKKGYIKAIERITEVNPGEGYVELIVEGIDSTSRIVRFSEKENQQVHKLVMPRLTAYLKDFGDTLKEKAQNLIGSKLPEEIKGGDTQE